MYKEWVLDASMSPRDGLLCFIPVDDSDPYNPRFIVGMNLLTSLEGFDQGRLSGIWHPDGQEAVDKWCAEHPEIMKGLHEKGKE